jgi:single-stranded DNA-binding protein
MITTGNSIVVCGRVAAAPELSHSSHGLTFWRFLLECERLSGAVDELPVLLSGGLPLPEPGQYVAVRGHVQSYNNRAGTGARLVIFIRAQELVPWEDPAQNHVALRGTLCKEPILRRTPFGREICDMTLAVPRGSPPAKSDYLPCIAWGQTAREAAALPKGGALSLEGRLQSRKYRKVYEDGREEMKTALEISVSSIEL